MKQHVNKIFWTLLAILVTITLIFFLTAPSEFDKTHDHYVFQELLIEYPLYKLKYNGNEVSKYWSKDKLRKHGIITLETEKGTGEVYINNSTRRKIPNTNVYVKLKSG